MAWTTHDIPDLTGKTAVITGANGGLGYESALALARKGAHVVMAARDQEKARRAAERIQESCANASLEIEPLDLGSLSSVADSAKRIVSNHDRIDILLNNAGLMALPERRTADGFEMQFGVNHLGHWAFTAQLLPSIKKADGARVVTVTSTAHHMGSAVDPKNPHLEGNYGAWKAYGQSKLANFHFAIGLQRCFEDAGLAAASLVAHPGLSDTNLQTHTVNESDGAFVARFFLSLAQSTGMDQATGALSQLRAATDPEAKGGEFYGPLFVNNGPPVRKPILRRLGLDRAIDNLWQVSQRETGISIELRARSREETS